MFGNLFNYDNPVWRFIGKLGDLMLLNLLWTICSIPLFTIGASTTAVYYVTLRLVRDEDTGTIRSFFHSFKQNFLQSTFIWLILLATGGILVLDMRIIFAGGMGTGSISGTIMTGLLGGMMLVYIIIFLYVFPLQSWFVNPVKRTIFNALLISLRHLPQTITIIITDLCLLALAYASLIMLPQLFAIVILFGIPLPCFVNSYFFSAIFDNYIPGEDE